MVISIDPPIILGTAAGFMALVYMRGRWGCVNAIADLDGAEVVGETVLRVSLATKADLENALVIQEQMIGWCGQLRQEEPLRTDDICFR